jgi:hypothetical protein
MVELIPKLLTVFFQLSICINYYKKVGIGELHKLFQSQNYSGPLNNATADEASLVQKSYIGRRHSTNQISSDPKMLNDSSHHGAPKNVK